MRPRTGVWHAGQAYGCAACHPNEGKKGPFGPRHRDGMRSEGEGGVQCRSGPQTPQGQGGGGAGLCSKGVVWGRLGDQPSSACAGSCFWCTCSQGSALWKQPCTAMHSASENVPHAHVRQRMLQWTSCRCPCWWIAQPPTHPPSQLNGQPDKQTSPPNSPKVTARRPAG